MRATVIKAGQAPRAAPLVRVVGLADLASRADAALRSAQTEAAAILAAAESAARAELERATALAARASEEGRSEGYRRGYEEGLAAGRREALDAGRAEFAACAEQAQSALRKAAAELVAQRDVLFARAERDVLVLAIAIAERLAASAARIDPGVAVESARRAVQQVRSALRVAIHVHPDDLARIETAAPELRAELVPTAEVQWVADDTIAVGGAVVRTDGGVVDAGLAEQLDVIAAQLAADWRQRLAALSAGGGDECTSTPADAT